MIGAGFVLIAGELAIFTEGDDVEPVAIGIEMIFGEVFIPFDVVLWAEFFGFSPGFGFDADELDVAFVGVFIEKEMAELMEEFKLRAVFEVGDGGGRRKTDAVTGGEGDGGVIFTEFICQRV